MSSLTEQLIASQAESKSLPAPMGQKEGPCFPMTITAYRNRFKKFKKCQKTFYKK